MSFIIGLAGFALGFVVGMISLGFFLWKFGIPFVSRQIAKDYPEVADAMRPFSERKPAVFAPQMTDDEALEYTKSDLQAKMRGLVEPGAQDMIDE